MSSNVWLVASVWMALALLASIISIRVGISVALYHGYLLQALRNVWYLLCYWRTMGPRPVPTLTLADAKGPRVAYAVPIVTGMLAALWLR